MYDFQFAEVCNASIIDRLHGGAGNLRMRRVSRQEAVQNRAPGEDLGHWMDAHHLLDWMRYKH
jgi:hypothetical protein